MPSRTDKRKEISEYIFVSKYARTVNGKKETWDEAVARVMQMHFEMLEPIAKDKKLFNEVFQDVWEGYQKKQILGAQRALQYGGDQLKQHHTRLYNCASSYCNRIDFFKELMYLLLSGCGTGYSVQKIHTSQLPKVKGCDNSRKEEFVVPDSIEGWSFAVDKLLRSYYEGLPRVEFDFSQIRPEGAYISGGFKAPGSAPLEKALTKITKILSKVKDRKLRPFELHRIACIIADSVISGGIRRSAMIALFDADEQEMIECKAEPNWFYEYPELSRANNSVVILPDTPKEVFDSVFEKVKKFGEPGFVFLKNNQFLVNPCCFTGDTMIAVADGRNAVSIEELAQKGEKFLVYSKNGKNKKEIKWAFPYVRGKKEVIKVNLSDGSSFKCTPDHPISLSDGTWIKAEESIGKELYKFFTYFNKYRLINSFSDGNSRQYRKIWEFYNGKKPKGFEIDHLDNEKGDFIENLQLLSTKEHLEKTSIERMGERNPVFRVKDKEIYSKNLSAASFLTKNNNCKGLSNIELIEIAKQVKSSGKRITFKNCHAIDSRFPLVFSKNRFGGKLRNLIEIVEKNLSYEEPICERVSYKKKDFHFLKNSISVVSIEKLGIETVYDIEVEDNHNFYILTKGYDEQYNISSGVLVHNCEVGMFPQIKVGNAVYYGWSFCNLSEINGALVETPEDFYVACRRAAILGTLQAFYTNFNVLSPASIKIAQRDALIGVGITGMCQKPDILFNPEVQRKGAKIVKEWNKKVADLLGMNPAARTTVVKPAGNSSQLLGTSSGISPFHFRKYIRHIQASHNEQAVNEILKVNPQMVTKSPYNPEKEYVIAFPVELDEHSLTRQDLTTSQFLEYIRLTQNNWIEEGTNFEHPSTKENPELRMNVSNTVTVKEGEWDFVRDYLWQYRNEFCGVSLLPESGDLQYPQAPYTSYLDEKELAETYGKGAVLSSGLIVDGLSLFESIWKACDAARGYNTELLKCDKNDVTEFIANHIVGDRFLVEINGIFISDVNAVIDYLNNRKDARLDWVRRFKKFAKNYFNGDEEKCANCLKHVDIFHKWQKICETKTINWNDIEWEEFEREAGEDVAAACHGGACELK